MVRLFLFTLCLILKSFSRGIVGGKGSKSRGSGKTRQVKPSASETVYLLLTEASSPSFFFLSISYIVSSTPLVEISRRGSFGLILLHESLGLIHLLDLIFAKSFARLLYDLSPGGMRDAQGSPLGRSAGIDVTFASISHLTTITKRNINSAVI